MSKRTIASVIACVFVALSGCKGPQGDGLSRTSATTLPLATATTLGNGIGQQFASGGITLTVTAAYSAPSFRYEGNTISQQTPDGKAREVSAPEGGRYVYVETTGMNGTKESIDLTCGYPVATHLVDDGGRQFDPVDGLSQIKGNPGCNEGAQAGFSFKIRWIYLVAPGAHIVKFRFQDVADFSAREQETDVPLPLP